MGEHLQHEMHEHSLQAFDEEREHLNKREAAIVATIGAVALTDRQIRERLGFGDMNAVRPRITELIKRGVLQEVAQTRDSVTGKRCRIVARRQRQAAFEFEQ